MFDACSHKQLLFGSGCLRYDQSTCLERSSPFWAIASSGMDGIVVRLVDEAKMMSIYNTSVLGPTYDG